MSHEPRLPWIIVGRDSRIWRPASRREGTRWLCPGCLSKTFPPLHGRLVPKEVGLGRWNHGMRERGLTIPAGGGPGAGYPPPPLLIGLNLLPGRREGEAEFGSERRWPFLTLPPECLEGEFRIADATEGLVRCVIVP